MVVVWKNVWFVGHIVCMRSDVHIIRRYRHLQSFAYICIVLDVVDFLDVNHVPSRVQCDGQKETSYRDGDANAMHESFRSEFLFACQSRS